MKEMTVEQKAKAYDEAIAHAKMLLKIIGNATLGNLVLKNEFKRMFPELAESEDERIRKGIVKYLEQSQFGEEHYCVDDDIVREYIAWLEKIGKNTTNKGESNLLTHERTMEISPFMRSGFENKDKVEPKFHKGDWVVWDNKIFCHVDNIYQGKNSLMYTITDTNNMTRSYSVKGFDNNAHLWTIQDAKDGDVLIFEGFYNSIVLFQGIGINGEGRINYHCKCDLGDYSFSIQGDVACLGTVERDAEHYHPATKEQRDLLFQKMKEAGYVWDSERKELKKVEQKPTTMSLDEAIEHCKEKSCGNNACALEHKQLERWLTELKELKERSLAWSEEDEKNLNDIIKLLPDLPNRHKWLKSLKDKVQPKQEWSKEDEICYTSIMEHLKYSITNGKPETYISGRLTDWINNRVKSLRPQSQWKPSDEQMNTLEYYMHTLVCNEHKEILFGLYSDLKKLKG